MSVVHISKQSVSGSSFVAGSGTVGTVEALLTTLSLPVLKGIVVRADSANSGTILVGAPNRAVAGYVLGAGDTTPLIPVENTDYLAIVGSGAGQNFSWFKV